MQTVDISKVRVFWGSIELTPASGADIACGDTHSFDWSDTFDVSRHEFDLPQISKAPRQPNQHHRFYCMQSAADAGEHRHPQQVVRDLAATHGFTVLGAVPQSIADGWDFWLEYAGNAHDGTAPAFPAYLRPAKWKPINQP